MYPPAEHPRHRGFSVLFLCFLPPPSLAPSTVGERERERERRGEKSGGLYTDGDALASVSRGMQRERERGIRNSLRSSVRVEIPAGRVGDAVNVVLQKKHPEKLYIHVFFLRECVFF